MGRLEGGFGLSCRLRVVRRGYGVGLSRFGGLQEYEDEGSRVCRVGREKFVGLGVMVG